MNGQAWPRLQPERSSRVTLRATLQPCFGDLAEDRYTRASEDYDSRVSQLEGVYALPIHPKQPRRIGSRPSPRATFPIEERCAKACAARDVRPVQSCCISSR